MATTKNATYKIFNGTDWDTYYFKTSAGQVGESGSRKFINPSTHTINGKKLFDEEGVAQGITLRGQDIPYDNTDDQISITQKVGSILTDIVLLQTGKAGTAAATRNTKGLMSSEDKTRLDSIWNVWSSDGDDDTLVNKVEEVLKVFETYTEGNDIVTVLSDKASLTGSNTYTGDNIFSGKTNINGSLTITANTNFIGEVEWTTLKARQLNGTDVGGSIYNLAGKWYYKNSASTALTSECELVNKLDIKYHQRIFQGPSEPTSKENGTIWIETAK